MAPTVLIADGSEFMRKLMKRLLSDQFDVLDSTAADGEEVVDLYKEFAPDVVVMEIAMPHRNGLKATAELKQFDDDARVVVCTHVDDENSRDMAEKAGAAAYVQKPFDRTDLVQSIRGVISAGA